MNQAFWHQRWQEGRTGWHQPKGHPALRRWLAELQLPPAAAVFVPLCGKSVDLLWLRARGHHPVGVELSPLAAEALFRENQLPVPRRSARDGLELYETDSLSLWCGDFFTLRPAHLGSIQGAFDRAALIALPPATRPAYAAQLQALLGSRASVLLVTLEYDQGQMEGPPFSVAEDEVRALFEPAFLVRLLERNSVLEQEPRFAEQGLTQLREAVYLLRPS